MARKLKRDKNGRFRYAANPQNGEGGKKGQFATKADIIAYTKVQRRSAYIRTIPKNRRLQNSVRTVAFKLGITEREAAIEFAEWLAEKEAAEQAGEEIPNVPGSP